MGVLEIEDFPYYTYEEYKKIYNTQIKTKE